MELGRKWSKPLDLDVLDLITIKRFVQPSREMPKLIWDINKGKSQSDYYEFEIFSEDSQKNDYELTKCSICNMEVPIPFINMHEKTKKHQMNLKIINIALKRMADHNIATRHDDQQTNINFCGVCSKVVKDDEKDHETSNDHKLSMNHDILLETFLSAYEDNTKMIKFNDTKNSIKIIRQYYTNIKNKLNVNGIKLINENTLQITSQVGTFRFDVNNFHGLSSVGDHLHCILCSVPVDEVQTHIEDDSHIERITMGLMKYCNRKIDEVRHHCIACNEIVHNIGDHILEQSHKEMFAEAYISIQFCDVCDCYVAGDIKIHNKGMRHKMKASQDDSIKDIKYHMKFDTFNGHYVCRICPDILLDKDEANSHVKSQEHLAAYQELMTKNAIFPRKDRVSCSACDIHIIEEYVLGHIFDKNHARNLVCLSTEGESENYMFETMVEGVQYKCKICSLRIQSKYLKEHLNSRTHNDKYETFLAYNQLRKRNRHYYCEKCQELVLVTTEIDHVGRIKHVDKMKEPLSWRVRREPEHVTLNTTVENRLNKHKDITETASASHVNRDTVTPNVDEEGCTSEAKESNIDNDKVAGSNTRNNANTGFNSTANVDNKLLSCYFKLNTVTADTKVSYLTMLKLNKITLLLDNTYRCGICDVIINFNDALIKKHVTDTLHNLSIASIYGDDKSLVLLNKELCSKKNKGESSEKHTSKAKSISNSDGVTGEIMCGGTKQLLKTNNPNKNLNINSVINRNSTTSPNFDEDEKQVIIKNEDCLFCTICEVYIIGDEDIARNAHLNSERHTSKSTGFKDNNEIRNISKEVSPEVTESKDEEIENKEFAHFCKICGVNVPSGEKNISIHNEGKKHNTNLNKILSDNIAIKMVNGSLFCDYCRIEIENNDLVDHLSSVVHGAAVTNVNNQNVTEILRSECKIDEAEVRFYNLGASTSSTVIDQISEDDPKTLICRYCKVQVPFRSDLFKEHIEDKKHKQMRDRFLTSSTDIEPISEDDPKTLICRYCKVEVPFRSDLFKEHIEGKTHKQMRDRFLNINSRTATVIKQSTDECPKTVICKYCKIEVPSRSDLFKEHFEGKTHKKKQKRFLNINKIETHDDKYHCTVCNETFDFGEEINHVNKYSHFLSEDGTNEFTNSIEDTLIYVNTKEKYQVTDKTSDKNMIVVANNGNMTCKLCNVGVTSIAEHLEQKVHIDKFQKLLTENNIIEMNDMFVCLACSFHIPKSVPIIFEHILEHSPEILLQTTNNKSIKMADASAICCQVCNKMLPRLNLGIHENSSSHKKNLDKIIADNAIKVRDDRVCYCKKCDLYFNKISALKHITSATHRNNI